MARTQGALADAETRRALIRSVIVAVAVFLVGIVGTVVGALRLGTAEDTSTAAGIGFAGFGILLIGSGVRRVLRAARTNTVLSAHRWEPWMLMGVYPDRGLIAVAQTDDAEEHLIRVDRWGSRRLRHERRKTPVYLAGEDRWWVITPVEGPRTVALGRMDVPYRRFHLVNPVDGVSPPDPDPAAPGSPTNGSEGP